MKKTYHGSCHCKAVTFEADIDLAQGTGKCNCSVCRKQRMWNSVVQPGEFRLFTGGDLPAAKLIAAPVHFMDGLHDNWQNPPEEVRHL